ncbi:hypothetical protein [Defluviimonas salinarum]|uniref:Na(+)-translocating NADH-quinone reductase subunit A n=1 Tax=Defluviimonas salinarum TaxID=2992147 RepID=A0ABT3J219_9RHOB|nr:hypothetical protein [Defluviimonas salinarum]MCW3781737.1 hypothetical protein [Defluviimonas salinarum]
MIGLNAIRERRIRPAAGPVGALRRPDRVALVGADYPGLRPVLLVAEGDRVRAGQALFTDRHHPEVAFVAPASGIVETVALGAGRRLSVLVVRLDAAPERDPPTKEVRVGGARAALLAGGLWPAFRRRPYGRIPAPDEVPEAIFVNAMPDRDGAPDPQAVLAEAGPGFDRGLDMVAELTGGAVFVCQRRGAAFATPGRERICTVYFPDPAAAGLSSHHIARLGAPAPGGSVWTVGWQDVVAMGELARTGRYHGQRVIAFHDGRGEAALFPTLLGAELSDLADLPGDAGAAFRLVSGARIGGREARFLGRYDTQAALVPVRRVSLFDRLAKHLAAGGKPRPKPILPRAALDTALPVAIPPVPLMRALAIGDVEAAERLGARGLVEEDVARLTHLCTSGSDYGRLLRRVLDRMEGAA